MTNRTKVVPVRAYLRVVRGIEQHVCAHTRSLPR